jgi:thiol-disulfide isomerase/thioredoxin
MNTKSNAFSHYVISLIVCCCCSRQSSGFAPLSIPAARMARAADGADSTTTALGYQNEGASPEFSMATARTTRTRFQRPIVSRKQNSNNKNQSIIRDLSSPQELVAFLENKTDNDPAVPKPAVVMFYASWCKKCQKVGLGLNRGARKLGGSFRFARFECTPSTHAFLVEAMGVEKVPNLRIYACGGSNNNGRTELVFDAGSSVLDLGKELIAMESMENAGLEQ